MLRSVVKAQSKQESLNGNALPILPTTRPRRLTVTTQSAASSPDGAPINHGIFGRLPLELRQRVLIEAFGNRTLHMYLTLDHPLPLERPKVSSRWKALVLAAGRKITTPQPQRHKKEKMVPLRHCGSRSRLVRDESRPKVWQWSGCVCHRRDKFTEEEINSFLLLDMVVQRVTPEWDQCSYNGTLCVCDSWSAEKQAVECYVGAMGWLLACRQSYAEGIDILYRTNDFHLSSRELIHNLPRCVLPQRLASIQSLELLWTLQSVWAPYNPNRHDEELHWLCDALPDMFPRLKKLYLSLQGSINGPGSRLVGGSDQQTDPVLSVELALLGPVEMMMLKFLTALEGREFSIAIPKSFWKILLWKHDNMRMPGLKAETDWCVQNGRFWKRFPRDYGTDHGYWVCSGQDDDMNFGLAYHQSMRWGLWHDGDPDNPNISNISCPHEIWGTAPPG